MVPLFRIGPPRLPSLFYEWLSPKVAMGRSRGYWVGFEDVASVTRVRVPTAPRATTVEVYTAQCRPHRCAVLTGPVESPTCTVYVYCLSLALVLFPCKVSVDANCKSIHSGKSRTVQFSVTFFLFLSYLTHYTCIPTDETHSILEGHHTHCHRPAMHGHAHTCTHHSKKTQDNFSRQTNTRPRGRQSMTMWPPRAPI